MAALAILALTALAGCVSSNDDRGNSLASRQDHSIAYDVANVESGKLVGQVTFRREHSQFSFPDLLGRWSTVVAMRATVDIDGYPHENSLLLSHADLAGDIAGLTGCATPTVGQCNESLEIEWFRPFTFISLLGAGGIPGLQILDNGTATLDSPHGSTSFEIRRESRSRISMRPIRTGTDRSASICNILDDPTVLDLERGLVVACYPGRMPNLVFNLKTKSVGITAWWGAEKAAPGSDSPFEPLEKPRGPLPPGSDFEPQPGVLELAEAHEAALSLSAKFRAYLASHPEANLASSGRIGYGSTLIGPTSAERRSEFFEATYTASNAEGFHILVQRNVTHVDGVSLPPTYTLSRAEEVDLSPVQGGSTVLPPKEMVSPRTVVDWISGLGRGIRPDDFIIIDTGETGEPRATYDYFFTFTDANCEKTCTFHEFIRFSATSNALMSGVFPPAVAASLFR